MCGPEAIHQRRKIGVDGDEEGALVHRLAQQCGVPGVRALFGRSHDVVPGSAQPNHPSLPGAAIDEEFHRCATVTSSIRLSATTAWA